MPRAFDEQKIGIGALPSFVAQIASERLGEFGWYLTIEQLSDLRKHSADRGLESERADHLRWTIDWLLDRDQLEWGRLPSQLHAIDRAIRDELVIPTHRFHFTVRNVIGRVLGQCPLFLSPIEARRLLITDLMDLPKVGVKRARQTVELLEEALEEGEPVNDHGGPVVRYDQISECLALIEEAAVMIPTTGFSSGEKRLLVELLGADANFLDSADLRSLLSTDLTRVPEILEKYIATLYDQLLRSLGRVAKKISDPLSDVEAVSSIIEIERLLPEAAAARIKIGESDLRRSLAESTSPAAMRVTRVWAMYDSMMTGRSLQAIGTDFGVSRERVRQLLNQYDATVKQARRYVARITQDELDARRDEVATFVRERPGVTGEEIIEELDFERSRLAELTSSLAHLILTPPARSEVARLEKRRQRVIDSLRAAAEIESPLSGPRYDELVRQRKVPGPSRQTAFIVFDTWSEACTIAGIQFLDPIRDDYERRWSDEEIIDVIGEFLSDESMNGTAAEYEYFARRVDGPSLALVRLRFAGSWKLVCRKALILLRSEWTSNPPRFWNDGGQTA